MRISLFLIIALVSRSALSAPHFPIVFVLYDAGETLALKPVMAELRQSKKEYRAIVMGAARDVMSGEANTIDITKDCKTESAVNRETWKREQQLPASDLEKINECFAADLLVTGMVSKVQYQIAAQMKKKKTKVVTFYDSLSPILSSLTESFLPVATTVFVPSQELAEKMLKLNSDAEVEVVGQPTLDAWAIGKEKLSEKEIFKRLPFIDKSRTTLLYAGQYGTQYEKAFRLFLKAAKNLTSYNLLVSLHPKADGSFERQAIADAKATNVFVLPKSLSTLEAAVISTVIVSQNSTVGVQACFMGKTVIYFDLPGSDYTDVAIEKGWATQVFDVETFARKAKLALSSTQSHNFDLYKSVGIPRDSSHLIVKKLTLLQSEIHPHR